MFDIATSIHVREDPTAPGLQGGNDLEQTLDLYKRAGDGFVGPGLGIGYAWASWGGAYIELAALGVMPFGAFVLAPSATTAFGF
jgi:hypothetical protein